MSVFSWWNNQIQKRIGGSYDPRSRAQIEEAEAEARAARAEKQPHMLRYRAQERYEADRADYFKGSPVELEGRPMTEREGLEWQKGKIYEALQEAKEHEIEGFVGRGVDVDVARRLVSGGGGNDKGAVFQLSHDYHLLERRLAALDAAEAAGAEPAQQADAYDVLEADVSEMSPEARAEFLSANSGEAEEIRSRLSDPSHSPVVGPKANVSGAGAGEAHAGLGGGDPMSWRRARGIWHYETPAEVAKDQRWAEKAWEAELAERAERAGVAAEGARAWEPVVVEPTAAAEPMAVDRGPLTAAEEALALEFMLDEPTRDEEKAEMREEFAQWNGVEAEAQSEPDVVVPDPEPEQGTEAPDWEADQQHAMAQLSGLQEVADREDWEAEPEAPKVAAPLGPEVPLVMGETLNEQEDEYLGPPLTEAERAKAAYWAAQDEDEAQEAAAEVVTPAPEPEAPVAMAGAPEEQGVETPNGPPMTQPDPEAPKVAAVVDDPALPSFYHEEVEGDARPLVPSMVPGLDLTSTETAAAEVLMWDEPKAQEAAPEVVVPAPEPEQGAPKVAAEAVDPEVPVILADTLERWEAAAEAPEAQGLETFDGMLMTSDPAEVAKKAQQTFEHDQMKAEQARRARKPATEPDGPSREPEPPGREPEL